METKKRGFSRLCTAQAIVFPPSTPVTRAPGPKPKLSWPTGRRTEKTLDGGFVDRDEEERIIASVPQPKLVFPPSTPVTRAPGPKPKLSWPTGRRTEKAEDNESKE